MTTEVNSLTRISTLIMPILQNKDNCNEQSGRNLNYAANNRCTSGIINHKIHGFLWFWGVGDLMTKLQEQKLTLHILT